MKNHLQSTFLIITFCFAISSAFAQAPVNNIKPKSIFKYELGLGLPYIDAMLQNSWKQMTPNISFKYVMNKNVIRSGLTYHSWKSNFESGSGFLGNIGYERRFFGPKLQMLAGADLCYLRENSYQNTHFPRTRYIIGAGPVLGGIYKFHPRFSLQTEFGFCYGFGQKKETNLPPIRQSTFLTQRWISFHLYYNFGKRK